jgi:hypothetical protein
MPRSSAALTTSEQEELELLEELLRRRRARRSLIDFTTYTNPLYQVAWHHRRIAALLEAAERREIKRLLIMAPPRHGKSELATVSFIAWYMGRNPGHEVISASYALGLAEGFSRKIREIMRSQQYRNVFPDVTIADDSQAVREWRMRGKDAKGNPLTGIFHTASKDSGVTGKGAHLFNLDDLTKDRLDVENEENRKKDWEWYTSVANTRLMPNAVIVATMTRWHEEDVMGKILLSAHETGEKWTQLVLPAENWPTSQYPDLEPYEALWPEWHPKEQLQITKKLNEYDWWALYQQTPRPPGGSFFAEAMLLENGKPVIPIDEYGNQGVLDYVVAIIDTAMKTGKEHDGLAVTYLGVARHGQVRYPVYVLDWDYKQIEGALLFNWLPTVFARCEELAVQYRARYGVAQAQIEDKGSGTVLLQQCANAGLPAMAIESGLTAMGKAERALDVANYVFAGNCKFTPYAYDKQLPFKGVHKNHLLTQILNFRAGTAETGADDCLDTWTYGLALVIGNYLGF